MNSSLPDSIFEISRISSINCNRNSLLDSIIFRYSCFSSSVSAWAIKVEKPTIAFKGVRISWLILAIKADFIRLLSSARRFACTSASWRLSTVISRRIPIAFRGLPSLLYSYTSPIFSSPVHLLVVRMDFFSKTFVGNISMNHFTVLYMRKFRRFIHNIPYPRIDTACHTG